MRSATLAEGIVDFALGCSHDDIPTGIRTLARWHMLDAIGVGLGAARLPSNHRLIASLVAAGAGGPSALCSVLGDRTRVTAPIAALTNGTLIHSLEYDDTHMASIVHGSAVIVPAALAAAQAQPLRTQDLVRLVTIGWEVLVRIGLAAPGAFQRRGFQVTSVAGALVAALIGALARGATREEVVSAIGIAGSQASGIFEFLSDGSSVKAMHPGWAAHSGLMAAELALAGMTGPASVLEGRFGLFRVHADAPDAAATLAGEIATFGKDWKLAQAAFKFHPCCHYIHPFLECAEEIRRQVADPERIVALECEVPPGEAAIICEPWDRKCSPASRNEAKHSLPYCVARTLLGFSLEIEDFAGQPVDAATVRYARRIGWREMPDSGFPDRFSARLQVRLDDGQTMVAHVAQVDGSADRPPTLDRIEEKFRRNAGVSRHDAEVQALIAALLDEADMPIGALSSRLQFT